MAEVCERAPEVRLETTGGEVSLAQLTARGKLVLAFYTEDSTPLCSSQVSMLKNHYELIEELGASVLAISSDSLESHREFAEQLGGVPFPLASDQTLGVAEAFGVADEEAKRCRRAVFVVERGTIIHAEPWFQPENPWHYEALFRALGFDG
jgi:peroxiredoxin